MYPTDLITNISPCPTTKEEHRNNGEYKGHKLTDTYSELQNTDHRKIIQLCTLHPFRLSQDNNIMLLVLYCFFSFDYPMPIAASFVSISFTYCIVLHQIFLICSLCSFFCFNKLQIYCSASDFYFLFECPK